MRIQPIQTPEEDEEYMLKPMNCPHHCEIYARLPGVCFLWHQYLFTDSIKEYAYGR